MPPSGIKSRLGMAKSPPGILAAHPSGEAMRGLLRGFALLLAYAAASVASEEGWCYASQQCEVSGCKEPREWAKLYPECGNNKQSPVNIRTQQVTYNDSLKAFNFINYDVKPNKWSMENSGHTVVVKLDHSGKVELGGLSGRYKAVQFHFHWGSEVEKTRSPGSEHSIDGERYPMELHIVHIKEEFNDVEAAAKGKGIAVLGFFIKPGKKNPNYESLISHLEEIGAKGDKVEIPAVRLESMIPDKKDLSSFYRYTGSLTTPGCSEEVVWTLFEEAIELGWEQIQEFWKKVYFDSKKTLPMVDNFRPIQPLRGRIVEKASSNLLLPPRNALLLVPTAACLAFGWIP
ncbi:carbonic anhydrase 4 [Crotalus tigris]|uniref:carbonic anhydrase 4 n=1 Tax=Crotalus tigris TaxID=88082 RepID=UPI00192F4FD8|nr:carbonic anhydrase 4 [Crotalus tigris]